MESKIRYILKHNSGLYFSPEATDTRGLTRYLFAAKRFLNEEQVNVYLRESRYRPDNPEEFRLVQVKQTIEEVQEDVQEVGEHQKHSSRAG